MKRLLAIVAILVAFAFPASAAASMDHLGVAFYSRCGNYQSASFQYTVDPGQYGNYIFQPQVLMPSGQIIAAPGYGPVWLNSGNQFSKWNINTYIPYGQGTAWQRIVVYKNGAFKTASQVSFKVCG